jgi:hypothetical protein
MSTLKVRKPVLSPGSASQQRVISLNTSNPASHSFHFYSRKEEGGPNVSNFLSSFTIL